MQSSANMCDFSYPYVSAICQQGTEAKAAAEKAAASTNASAVAAHLLRFSEDAAKGMPTNFSRSGLRLLGSQEPITAPRRPTRAGLQQSALAGAGLLPSPYAPVLRANQSWSDGRRQLLNGDDADMEAFHHAQEVFFNEFESRNISNAGLGAGWLGCKSQKGLNMKSIDLFK